MVPAAERAQLARWSGGAVARRIERCVHEWFEAHAARAPEAVAVIDGGRRVSYGELDRGANRLAHHLRERGVGAEHRVALCVERSAAMVEVILAIVKAGGAYVPLDPAYASSRLGATLSDARPAVLVIDAVGSAALGAAAIERARGGGTVVIDVTADAASWGDAPSSKPAVAVEPGQLAYVIYTSGSTGQPKGVMVEHAQLARLFEATAGWFGFGADDVWALVNDAQVMAAKAVPALRFNGQPHWIQDFQRPAGDVLAAASAWIRDETSCTNDRIETIWPPSSSSAE